MPVSGAIVLFAIIWFMCLFISLQVRITSQSETGDVVPGTPPSAPGSINLKQRFLWVTVATFMLWTIISLIILYGGITVQDLDFFGHFSKARG